VLSVKRRGDWVCSLFNALRNPIVIMYPRLDLQNFHALLTDYMYGCCVIIEAKSDIPLGTFNRLIYVINKLCVFFEIGLEIFSLLLFLKLAEALRYKPEVRVFDSGWGH
jgi:hypothetical protein